MLYCPQRNKHTYQVCLLYFLSPAMSHIGIVLLCFWTFCESLSCCIVQICMFFFTILTQTIDFIQFSCYNKAVEENQAKQKRPEKTKGWFRWTVLSVCSSESAAHIRKKPILKSLNCSAANPADGSANGSTLSILTRRRWPSKKVFCGKRCVWFFSILIQSQIGRKNGTSFLRKEVSPPETFALFWHSDDLTTE